jgi:hypothetical protein
MLWEVGRRRLRKWQKQCRGRRRRPAAMACSPIVRRRRQHDWDWAGPLMWEIVVDWWAAAARTTGTHTLGRFGCQRKEGSRRINPSLNALVHRSKKPSPISSGTGRKGQPYIDQSMADSPVNLAARVMPSTVLLERLVSNCNKRKLFQSVQSSTWLGRPKRRYQPSTIFQTIFPFLKWSFPTADWIYSHHWHANL